MASASGKSLRRTSTLSIFSSIIAVLSVLGNFIHFGPFPITLALAPIVIGAALYGVSAGAFLGGVFGVVTLICGLFGWDGGAVLILLNASPFWLLVMCIGKGIAAGWMAGLVYGLLEKKNSLLAVIAAGIVCPLTNTGIFVLGMYLFFRPTLTSWSGGTDTLSYIIFGLTGINFLVEVAVNMVLSSGITSIIKYGKGRRA